MVDNTSPAALAAVATIIHRHSLNHKVRAIMLHMAVPVWYGREWKDPNYRKMVFSGNLGEFDEGFYERNQSYGQGFGRVATMEINVFAATVGG
jgi:hypothetical protein